EVVDQKSKPVQRAVTKRAANGQENDKGDYDHFMMKEIHEQPDAIEKTICANMSQLCQDDLGFKDMPRLTIVACGTSYYAANVAKYWFEKFANLSVEIDIASEFRYRDGYLPENGTALFISQSGETADTLAALRYAKEKKQKIIALVNVENSSIAREADMIFHTKAGTEIGVASTKAFTTQLSVMALLALKAGRERGVLNHAQSEKLLQQLDQLPTAMRQMLENDEPIREAIDILEGASSTLFIGRNSTFPIAMEGALKLKEISYIHAEGFGAGELKHGPIALIDQDLPVIALLPHDHLYEKTLSSIYEVKARGAKVIAVGPQPVEGAVNIPMEDIGPLANPIIYALPMQLIAYYAAVARECDVDRPRNLAKSVTVE
ncbi:MAG: glutamine--fructose-6-phosphate transaminase (isomerizing), partial [Alphaproteobacteria bacterium]|nr:glutamine--fructose-6-phosphate transaminase (isomerizing) [Alphaproteobacteria bacterium]